MTDTDGWDPKTALSYHQSKIAAIAHALSLMEGHAFGSRIRFTTHYGRLAHYIGDSFSEVEWTRDVPYQQELADSLNAVVFPVVKAHCEKLRQEMANHCAKLAAVSLGPTQFKRYEMPKDVSHETS